MLNITITNKNEQERFLLVSIIGLMDSLLLKAITIEDSNRALFTPYTVSLLKKENINIDIIELINQGCELENISSLLHENLDNVILGLKNDAIKLLTNLNETSYYEKWLWLPDNKLEWLMFEWTKNIIETNDKNIFSSSFTSICMNIPETSKLNFLNELLVVLEQRQNDFPVRIILAKINELFSLINKNDILDTDYKSQVIALIKEQISKTNDADVLEKITEYITNWELLNR